MPKLNILDMQAAFQQDEQLFDFAMLSGQGMKVTEGVFGWFAAIFVVNTINTIWGWTSRSPRDRVTSAMLGIGLSYAQCGAPPSCFASGAYHRTAAFRMAHF